MVDSTYYSVEIIPTNNIFLFTTSVWRVSSGHVNKETKVVIVSLRGWTVKNQ